MNPAKEALAFHSPAHLLSHPGRLILKLTNVNTQPSSWHRGPAPLRGPTTFSLPICCGCLQRPPPRMLPLVLSPTIRPSHPFPTRTPGSRSFSEQAPSRITWERWAPVKKHRRRVPVLLCVILLSWADVSTEGPAWVRFPGTRDRKMVLKPGWLPPPGLQPQLPMLLISRRHLTQTTCTDGVEPSSPLVHMHHAWAMPHAEASWASS